MENRLKNISKINFQGQSAISNYGELEALFHGEWIKNTS